MMDDSVFHRIGFEDLPLPPTPDIFKVFPTEIVFTIFRCLDLPSLCLCRHLSRKWREQVNRYLTSVICLDFVPHEAILTENGLKHVLIRANDLQVLHLDRCWPSVTEENLFVIAQNCSKLSVFTASRCKGVTDAALEAVAMKCPKLTEVDLSSCFKVLACVILSISKSEG